MNASASRFGYFYRFPLRCLGNAENTSAWNEVSPNLGVICETDITTCEASSGADKVLASIENLGIFLRRRVNELRREAAMTVLGTLPPLSDEI